MIAGLTFFAKNNLREEHTCIQYIYTPHTYAYTHVLIFRKLRSFKKNLKKLEKKKKFIIIVDFLLPMF